MKTLVILAGGKSSRMGRDKVFLEFNRGTFLSEMVVKAVTVFERIIISGGTKEHSEKIYSYIIEFGSVLTGSDEIEVYQDNYESLGPIGGLLTIFERTGLDSFAVTAIDAPFADMKVLETILDSLTDSSDNPKGKPAAMFLNSEGRFEACVAAYSRDSYKLLKGAADKGQRSLVKALGEENILPVDMKMINKKIPEIMSDETIILRNVNTETEYRAL